MSGSLPTNLPWAALELLSEGAFVIDADGRIIWLNPALAEMLGYDSGRLVGQPIELLVPEAQRAAHVRLREDFARQPRHRAMGGTMELTARRADGSVIPVEIGLSPLGEAHAGRTLGLVTNTTLRREVLELRRDQELQSARLDVLSQTALALAHHIRNAVAIILMQADAMTDDDPAAAAMLREHALTSGRRIAAIVDALMDLVHAGEIPLTETGVGEERMLDLEPLIEQHLRRIESAAG